MEIVWVELGNERYPIYIQAQLLASGDLLSAPIAGQQVLIVTNNVVAPLYLDTVMEAYRGFQCDTVILPDGEQYKTLDEVNKLFDVLLTKQHRRNTTLVALGGGVVGDMTGFAAACYQRGVPFIQIPTSLLAQVDASVGGKTGVNHPLGKNMIGAFHQPLGVFIDISTLATLPDREFKAGLAEVIKAALIQDKTFFEWLEQHVPALLAREEQAITHAITRACTIKANIVAEDEREQGVRALLNFGHTLGHAIERSLGYGQWLHGEAVAVGMLMAAALSEISEKDFLRIEQILLDVGLPIRVPAALQCTELLGAMALDKKKKDERRPRLVLLEALGRAVVCCDVTEERIGTVIETLTRCDT